jgi:hypothetical protein
MPPAIQATSLRRGNNQPNPARGIQEYKIGRASNLNVLQVAGAE